MTDTICAEIKELVDNRLSEIDDKLIDLITKISTGNYSNLEIISDLNDLRKKVW